MKASSSLPKAVDPVEQGLLTFEHELDLPVAPGFVSVPPRIPLAAAIEMIEELRPLLEAVPREWERRSQEKITVPFEL